ncbi:MAG: N-acetylmuramoyl-L-alanine amidase [Lachnospiraceae bacterium]|nr:N-acetylmuramoyl-L-alanine amidase [Lachnospiraceae bacterium]
MPVIALDPGHGGSNSGLSYNGLLEKHITRITAQAMKEELETYEGVTVIITDPDENVDMSLAQRATVAKDQGADVLISLHFNMSEEHTMFGSEVWVPCKGVKHADMHSLGDEILSQFSDIGLTIRGVKTRLNDRGTDYYGIIRESVARDMPALLIEHCYADHAQDAAYMASDDNFAAFGKMDAEAVAKYYHLRSKDGTKDFTQYVKNGYFTPEEAVRPDKTGPEAVALEWLGPAKVNVAEDLLSQQGDAEGQQAAEQVSEDALVAGFGAGDGALTTPDGRVRTSDVQLYHISGNEPETYIVYYENSYDGVENWSGLLPFEKNATQMDIEIPGVMPGDRVMARLYNGYTVSGSSNIITYKDPPPMYDIDADRDIESLESAYQSSKTSYENFERYYDYSRLWSGVGLVLTALCVIGFTATIIEGRRLVKKGWSKRQLVKIQLAWSIVTLFLLAGSLLPRYLLARVKDDAAAAMDGALSAKYNAQDINRQHDEKRLEQEQKAKELIVTDTGIVEGEYIAPTEQETVVIYDIAKGYMRVPMLDITKNPYDLSAFSGQDLQKTYISSTVTPVLGIDVSKFQGEIDWQSVAASGVKYVIIRLGSRGYGSGELVMDDKFVDNIEGASLAGLKVGVYFFSTALNDKEAVEEADFVLKALQGYSIEMPVVFDTEIITYDKSRNADMTPNQLTSATIAFCERIKNAGLTPMIYANAKRFTTMLHLEQLEGYEKWLADYRETPDYPYNFRMWQFTEKGSVPGIEGNVDINLYFAQ